MLSSAGFCPVARRIIDLDSDYKGTILIRLTVDDAGMRVEIATDGPNRNRLIRLPNLLRHDPGTVAAYVDCGCEFEGWMIRVIEIHKRLHGNTRFLPAQGGRLCQRISFGPGGPIRGSLPVRFSEAMVRGDSGPLGWSPPVRRRLHGGEVSLAWEKTSDAAILGFRSEFRLAPQALADRSCGPELWSSWFRVQLIHNGV